MGALVNWGNPSQEGIARRVQQALHQADFTLACAANEELCGLPLEAAPRLFCTFIELKLAAYQSRRLPVQEILSELELLRAKLCHDPHWPLYFYLQAWLTAPFVDDYRIDPFYLLHLTGSLARVGERQDCLLAVVYYGTQYTEAHFMSRIAAQHPFDDSWLASPYHRAMVSALLAAYHREGSALRAQLDGLRRAAGSPLEEYEVTQLERRFAQFLPEGGA